MTLDAFGELAGRANMSVSLIGSMLFSRCVSGTRVIAPGVIKTIGAHEFHDYGAHVTGYPHAYLTAAAAVGMAASDVDAFLSRLDKVLIKFRRKCMAAAGAGAGDIAAEPEVGADQAPA